MQRIIVALLGWLLAYYGEEVTPLLSVEANSSDADLVAPVVRTIGWLFLGASRAIVVANLAGFLQ